ncbi:hypothetical protein NDU88_005925 [Pleurodeles waltl]|uniref:CCHC-type domain-containing protein n=1 Tax=Pleurodeles waltl TaxID=8319 RepID=A0AAV7QJL9_PLEWA|nr:hypothetical protein NDU88_005925 [Pleurodeles waltl]
MLPADRASELRSIARKTIRSVVSASELLDSMKGWTEKEQLYFTEAFGTEVIELYWKYSDELEPDDVAADHKQMRDGLFVFSQMADAIRRLVKLCVVAVRLQEEKRAVDVVARTSQTSGVQASIFGTDKTMIVHAKPMREAAPLYVPPKGLGTSDDKTSVDAKGYFIYNWVYTPWNRADVMALKTALPDPRKNPAAFYEEVEGAISSCTVTLADIDLFFGLILLPDMWRTFRKGDDRVVFGASWKELEQIDGDREPAKKPYQLILDHPAAILVNGQLLSDDTGRHLFVDKYVANLLRGIASRLKASESSWTTSTPVSLLTMAQYYEGQELEAKGSEDKKIKELKTKVMLAQAYGPPFRGSDIGGRGSYGSSYTRSNLSVDQCAYCKKFGHWAADCPALRVQQCSRGRRQMRNRSGYSGPRRSTNDHARVDANVRGQDGFNTFDRRNQYQMSNYVQTDFQDFLLMHRIA